MEDIRILVVDDHPLIREGLVEIIRRKSGMQVVGQAANGTDAIETARRCRPDVTLLDIKMPGMDGLEALRRISSEVPETRVIVLTIYQDDRMIVEAVRLGAIGYLHKTCPINELVKAIRMAHQGQPTLPSRAVPALLAALRSSGGQPGSPALAGGEKPVPALLAALRSSGGKQAEGPHPDEMADRELRILSLVAQGKTNRDIGQVLGLSEATVRNQLCVMFQKLHVRNRAEAVARGYELGLLPGRY